eukprot:3135262-Alexandrium_andersonii.AAC.1
MISLSPDTTRTWVGAKSRWRDTSCVRLRASWGGGPPGLREVKLPSRIIWWAKEGPRCEADLRHAEQLPRGLMAPGKDAKQVSFPGFKRELASVTDAELLGAASA